MIEIKPLSKELIHCANSNSFGGKRGDISEHEYYVYAEQIKAWNISDSKKQKLLDILFEKRSEILKYEAKHVSVMAAGASNYNSKKLDHSAKILELSSEFSEWFKEIKEQVESGTQERDKVEELKSLIEFCRQDKTCDPTFHIAKLASYDPESFKQYYDEFYPIYKWRKNSAIAKLYAAANQGKLKLIKKEMIFEDENFKAFYEGDRAYICFVLKPKRQLIVALKSRGYWWNSGKRAWSTYHDKVDKEWIETISTRYADYI